MVSRTVIFWDVDTQVDFMLPGGKLYVPGAEKLIPNLKLLTDAAREGRVFIIGDACTHTPDDPEFDRFPRHCVRGTLAAGATVLLVAAPLVAASSAAAAAVPRAAGHGRKKVHDPGRVTGTIHGHCSYRDHGQLPDPRCTPGSIDPHVTQADIRSTICKKGWTASGRCWASPSASRPFVG